MFLTNKQKIEHINKSDVRALKYFPVDEDNEWKVECIRELMSTREGDKELDGFHSDEMNQMLEYLCVS